MGTDDWGEKESNPFDIFTTSYDQEHTIKSYAIHPKYSSSTHYYDLAVIETKEKMSFTEGVQPICLPESPTSNVDNRKSDKVYVAGFGFATSGNGLCSDTDNTKLRATSLSIFGYKFCNDSIGPDGLGTIKAEKVKKKLPLGF